MDCVKNALSVIRYAFYLLYSFVTVSLWGLLGHSLDKYYYRVLLMDNGLILLLQNKIASASMIVILFLVFINFVVKCFSHR